MPSKSPKKSRYVFHPRFIRFLRILVGPYVRNRFQLSGTNTGIFNELKPPFIVLGNHVNNWDPFIVNLLVPHQMFWVTSDVHFRNPALTALMGLVGCISKKKAAPDVQTIRDIMTVRDIGGVIGLFPEGQASWDGGALPIFPATAKLLRMINVPIVTAVLRGSFLARPRWQRKRHYTSVNVRFDTPFAGRDLRKMKPEEIYAVLTESLGHDEYVFQKQARQRIRGRRRAEYLERSLFICPECLAEGRLHSHDRYLTCGACGYRVEYDPYGMFVLRGGPGQTLHFDNMRDWNQWQQERLRNRIEELRGDESTPVLHDGGIYFHVGGAKGALSFLGDGDLTLYAHELLIVTNKGERRRIPMHSLSGMNVQTSERMEFYHQETIYRCQYKKPNGCMYKYYSAIRYLQETINAPTQ